MKGGNEMAWTDQCKIAFMTNAEGLIHNGKGVREALREMSKDSGVPYGTLRRWYYPKEESVPKNGNGRKLTQKAAWKNAEKMMDRLIKYLYKNCEFPPDDKELAEKARAAIGRTADDLNLFYEDFYN